MHPLPAAICPKDRQATSTSTSKDGLWQPPKVPQGCHTPPVPQWPPGVPRRPPLPHSPSTPGSTSFIHHLAPSRTPEPGPGLRRAGAETQAVDGRQLSAHPAPVGPHLPHASTEGLSAADWVRTRGGLAICRGPQEPATATHCSAVLPSRPPLPRLGRPGGPGRRMPPCSLPPRTPRSLPVLRPATEESHQLVPRSRACTGNRFSGLLHPSRPESHLQRSAGRFQAELRLN